MDKAAAESRQKLSFDIEDDTPLGPIAEARKIEEIGEKAGFRARVAPPVARKLDPSKVAPVEKKAEVAAKPRRVRATTGRTYPFNTKIREATYDAICRLADEATAQEGRVVSLAEIVERGTALLEAQRRS
jgi:hypothetical protein